MNTKKLMILGGYGNTGLILAPLLLQESEAQLVIAGRCFITDGGFHPGLPGVLVRYAAGFFDLGPSGPQIESARARSARARSARAA
jgi:saccharopine dehydrogenase-like NADP-dependent oxidoreductase